MIKNQYITFINTSRDTKSVQVNYVLSGNPGVAVINLSPGEVFNEASAKLVIAKDAEIVSVKTPDSKGNLKEVLPTRLASSKEILKASVVLDIETTELRAGAPITQLAVTSIDSKKSTLFIPSSQDFIATTSSVEKSISFQHRLQARGIKIPEKYNFRDIKYAEAYINMKGINLEKIGDDEFQNILKKIKSPKNQKAQGKKAHKKLISDIEDHLISNDKFQAKLFVKNQEKLKKAGVSVNQEKRILMDAIIDGSLTDDQVKNYLRQNQGVLNIDEEMNSLRLVKDRSLRDIINSDVPELIKGKVTWIANANFESGQFGARIRAQAEEARAAYNLSVADSRKLEQSDFIKAFNKGQLTTTLEDINKTRDPSSQLITRNPYSGVNLATGKPFDVTGTGVFDTARAKAFKTGDFSDLYEAMLMDTRPGDVRDPTDLSRSLQSKLKKIGVLDIDKPSALSVEVQSRLALAAREMRLAEEAGETLDPTRLIQSLKAKETHIAIGDTVLSETPLVREYFDLLESLRVFEAGGEEAQELINQSKQGKGGLHRALVVGSLQDYFNKGTVDASGDYIEGLDDVLFKQRIGRTLEDIATSGETEVRVAKPGLGVKTKMVSQEGIDYFRKINTQSFIYERKSTINEVVDLLKNVPEYSSADKQKYIDSMLEDTKGFFDSKGNLIKGKQADLLKVARRNTESADAQIKAIENRLPNVEEFSENLKSFSGIEDTGSASGKSSIALNENVASILESNKSVPGTSQLSSLAEETGSSLRRALGRGIIGAALIGVGFKLVDEGTRESREKRNNYTLPDFEDFMKAQASFYGSQESFLTQIREKYNVEGLQESGIMAEMRKLATDFGSPYQGMGYSTSVLDNYALRRERQKYEQAQFGSRHFSVDGDVGFQLKRFMDSTFRKQMGYSRKTSALFYGDFKRISSGKYNSLKGDNIIEHKAKASEITVEDADTITIKRNGSNNNSLSQFMGIGQQDSMSIRLAGIDAPETAHGDRSAQPYAEKAKQIAKELISKAKDIRVVSRQDDTTYGRQVSMVYLDGKNLNLELVRRGAAAFLPFRGKGKSSFYNQRAFEEAEKQASEGNRGMWSDPYFRAYQMVKSRSGQSITFNTLVNASKVAKSSQLMSVAALMEEAGRAGEINNHLAEQLVELGETQRVASSASKRSIYSPDKMRGNGIQTDLQTFGSMGNSINSVLDQLKYEISELQRTKGSKNTAETARVRKLSSNNMNLAKDSIKKAQREYDFEKEERIKKIQAARLTKQKRINDMQYMQHTALGNLFNSPINHHRM